MSNSVAYLGKASHSVAGRILWPVQWLPPLFRHFRFWVVALILRPKFAEEEEDHRTQHRCVRHIVHNTHPRSRCNLLRQTACCEATTRLLKNGRNRGGHAARPRSVFSCCCLLLWCCCHTTGVYGSKQQHSEPTAKAKQRSASAVISAATRLSSRWDFSHDCDFARTWQPSALKCLVLP